MIGVMAAVAAVWLVVLCVGHAVLAAAVSRIDTGPPGPETWPGPEL